MTHETKLVEAMAKAARPDAWGDCAMTAPQPLWAIYKRHRDSSLREAARSLDAIEAAGCVVVPREPTPGLLMSMALRCDHELGAPGMEQRIQFGMSAARQQHEEVVGAGFYRPEKEAEYAARAARPGAQP